MASQSLESRVLQEYYSKLVSTLAQCIDEDLLPALVSAKVITIDDKNTIKRYGNRPTDGIEYFLDKHVNRPLCVGITDNFAKLLRIMQNIPGYCKSLADEMVAEIAQTFTDSGLMLDTPQNVPVNSKLLLKGQILKQVRQPGTNFCMQSYYCCIMSSKPMSCFIFHNVHSHIFSFVYYLTSLYEIRYFTFQIKASI